MASSPIRLPGASRWYGSPGGNAAAVLLCQHLAALARHTGVIRNPRPGQHELFGFLTTQTNAVVRPVHPKAMPVILSTPDEIRAWLTADWKDARSLQWPLPDQLFPHLLDRNNPAQEGAISPYQSLAPCLAHCYEEGNGGGHQRAIRTLCPG